MDDRNTKENAFIKIQTDSRCISPFLININEQLIIYKNAVQNRCERASKFIPNFFFFCQYMPCGCKRRHVYPFNTHSTSRCKIKVSLWVFTSCETRRTCLWGGYHKFSLTPCRWWGSKAHTKNLWQNMYFLRQFL